MNKRQSGPHSSARPVRNDEEILAAVKEGVESAIAQALKSSRDRREEQRDSSVAQSS